MGLGPPGAKKKGQKGLLKAEAGELDLIEIHTKHTLKKCQHGKSKNKNKVSYLRTEIVEIYDRNEKCFSNFFSKVSSSYFLTIFVSVFPAGFAFRRV